MTVIARELVEIARSFYTWQVYDPAVKADLFSTALALRQHLFLVDPVYLESTQLARLQKRGTVSGIIVTNTNHHRAATWYSEHFAAPILARSDTFPQDKPERFAPVRGQTRIANELEVIELEGAVAGELALYHAADGGTLIVGDALINFEPYGFTLLPRKYCRNEKEMRRSLRKLLDREVQRIFFAHGMPILSGAGAHLRQLFGPNA